MERPHRPSVLRSAADRVDKADWQAPVTQRCTLAAPRRRGPRCWSTRRPVPATDERSNAMKGRARLQRFILGGAAAQRAALPTPATGAPCRTTGQHRLAATFQKVT